MNYPVIIKVSCELSDDGQSAILCLHGGSDHTLHLTIIHEGASVAKHEIFGDESCKDLVVRYGECIVVLARLQGEIVAFGVFQVNLGLFQSIASLFLAMGSENIELIYADVEASIGESEKVEVAA